MYHNFRVYNITHKYGIPYGIYEYWPLMQLVDFQSLLWQDCHSSKYCILYILLLFTFYS